MGSNYKYIRAAYIRNVDFNKTEPAASDSYAGGAAPPGRIEQNRGRVSDHYPARAFTRDGKSAPDLIAYEPLLNDSEAARFLGGIHPKTVQRMARRGELPCYRVGKYWRYRASELSEWLMLHSSGQNNPPAPTT